MRGIRRSCNHAVARTAALVATYVCTVRKRVFLFILLLLSMFTTTILSMSNSRLAREELLSMKLAEIQNEMEFLLSSYRARQEEINILQMQVDAAPHLKCQLYCTLNTTTTLSPEAAMLLRTVQDSHLTSGLITKKIRGALFVNQVLHHKLDNYRSLYPGYHMKGQKNFSQFVLGIPTVKRDKESYLLITLEYLLAGLKNKYEKSTLIVICVGETDLKYVIRVAGQVKAKFPKEVKSGLIEVISPSPEFYPDFSNEKPNLGDSQRRFRWRTKQNLDAIFLMAYAQTKGTYYLMLEDDIISVPTYMDTIKNYTAKMSVAFPEWLYIEYCTVGGIGKLFKSSILKHFVVFVELFYRHMPLDWLLEKYIETRECSFDLKQEECARIKTKLRPRYSANLFQHIGLFSSLKGKIHKIKENKIVKVPKFLPHTNPPLELANTTIKIHKEYTLLNAYLGSNFFWGIRPKKGDFVEFVFKEPVYVDSFLFRSGNVDHISDKFFNTIVEIIPSRDEQNATITVGHFDEFGVAEGNINKDIGPLQSIRLNVLKNLTNWVILSEISLSPWRRLESETKAVITSQPNEKSDAVHSHISTDE